LSKSVFKAANKGSRRKSFKSPSRSGKKEKLRDRETEREREKEKERERERERRKETSFIRWIEQPIV
jgi:hypothetical protein